jgi:ribosome-binding factor A
VTLTRVDVAPDLTSALVFWSAFDVEGRESIETVSAGLESASSFVRRRVAQQLPLKRTPELRFRYDPSLAQGSETLSLLRSLGNGEEE